MAHSIQQVMQRLVMRQLIIKRNAKDLDKNIHKYEIDKKKWNMLSSCLLDFAELKECSLCLKRKKKQLVINYQDRNHGFFLLIDMTDKRFSGWNLIASCRDCLVPLSAAVFRA